MAFPDDRDRELQQRSLITLDLADELIDWVGQFNHARKAQDLAPVRENDEFQLLQLRRKAASLTRSSRVPVAAAVYGPSQTGKSLFVGRVTQPRNEEFSPLGRDEKSGPPAYVKELTFDFDLNPRCGANEATAIVTRFTTKDRFDNEAPQKYPVMVKALSRSEWLRVLARGFLSECERPSHVIWQEGELDKLFDNASRQSPGDSVDREWRMDLLDVYAYMKRLEPRLFHAEEAVFNGCLSRYPLSQEGYVEIAAQLFWDNWHDITNLFNETCAFLNKLKKAGHEGMMVHWMAVRFLLDSERQDDVESPKSKCFPRVKWSDIVAREEQGWFVLDYQPGAGPPREELAIMQSSMLELVIPVLPDRLTDEWRHVLEEIDFLDIPGMRAEGRGGEGGGMKEKDADSRDKQMLIVKRGKVFYLFDRYIEELQAQTLLMLIRGGKNDVRGLLKEYIDKWGRTRYGKDAWPDKVRENPPALFLGMTGIDEEFQNEPAQSALYNARLKQIVNDTFREVMTDFGGKNKAFQNIYPIRYPGTWDADETRRQREGVEKWDKAKLAFLESKEVKEYVEAAEQKWNAAMRDGDGGASLIAKNFRATTSSLRKQDALKQGIEDTHRQLLQLSAGWLVDADANLDREKRVQLARVVLDWLKSDEDLIYARVQALEESLCFKRGDAVYYLAEFADVRTNRKRPDPVEKRFPIELAGVLKEWGSTLAPREWETYVREHEEGAPWLEAETFGTLSRYLADSLCRGETFDALCNRLLQIVNLKSRDEGARRNARRKYTWIILNDFILNPGPDTSPLQPVPDSNGKDFGLMHEFVNQWESRLPMVLAAGAGQHVQLPPGNQELGDLLDGPEDS